MLIVVLEPEVCDQFFSDHVSERVLQLHQLNEQVVLRIQAGRMHRALEVERQPLLDPGHASALREVEEQREVEHDRRGENAVAAQEIDLQLHLVAKPPHQIDVVPPLFVVAARRIVVDADDVTEILVELRIQLRLEDVVEHRLLALFLRLE